ncbi:MAG TPA: class I SAM-dependent methyltransferase [Solirubrobacterales bacterium]|nr:class I SAM-dependent methyltransferase [Solirubrobacterales bacterium]
MPGASGPRVTGERVSTARGGFNPTWQRHVAAYALCAPLLPDGKVLDLGCGVGHSFERLAPRETVGVDIDPGILAGQQRETSVADMRALPFADATFASVLCVQAIEHVPDPERVLHEARRVLAVGGPAVFVTPNRLTFGPPDEVVDPYHYVEFSAEELRRCCGAVFEHVELFGIFGSARYLELVARERSDLERVLRWDALRLRRAIPRSMRMRLYDRALRRRRLAPEEGAAAIEPSDFTLRDPPLEQALDLVAVCSS